MVRQTEFEEGGLKTNNRMNSGFQTDRMHQNNINHDNNTHMANKHATIPGQQDT